MSEQCKQLAGRCLTNHQVSPFVFECSDQHLSLHLDADFILFGILQMLAKNSLSCIQSWIVLCVENLTRNMITFVFVWNYFKSLNFTSDMCNKSYTTRAAPSPCNYQASNISSCLLKAAQTLSNRGTRGTTMATRTDK